MEKPGMDRRCFSLRSRLLNAGVAFFCFLHPLLIQAQTDPEPVEEALLTVEVQIPPEEPALHTPWVITFLVDHPSPGEVTVSYPPLPGAFSLESIRTGSRIVEQKRWTAVEFWLIPQQPGTVTLKPFELITPDKKFLTNPIFVHIQGTIREYRPYFSWETPPGSLQIGEKALLSLRLINWDPRKPFPNMEPFLGAIPEQMILEEQPLSESDQSQGIILRLEVIPLGGQQFTLKPIHFQYEGLTLEVPGISIPIIPRKQEELETQGDTLIASPKAAVESPLELPFPEIPAQVFPLFRTDYERNLQVFRRLWYEGQIPEALAEMRRNEREQLAGPHFTLLRQEAERIAGLELTQDEPWRPRKIIVGILLGSLTLLILMALLFLSKRKSVTSPLSWGYKSIALILIVLVIAALLVLAKGSGERGSAVLRAAAAYRVPDIDGGVSAYFKDGQPVVILSVSDAWVYVESFDGRLGWVLRDKVIVY